MDSRSYTATNSRNVNQGDDNQLTDNSVTIAKSFNERQKQIGALDDLIAKLKTVDQRTETTTKAETNLVKVRDEIADEEEPNKSMIKKWLENAKNLLGSAALGFEVTEAAKKLWEMFGT